MVHCGTSWTNVEAKNVECDDAHHRGDTSLANDMVNSQDSQLHVLWYIIVGMFLVGECAQIGKISQIGISMVYLWQNIPNWCSENVPKS